MFCIRLHVGVALCIFFTLEQGQYFFKYVQTSESSVERTENPSSLVWVLPGEDYDFCLYAV